VNNDLKVKIIGESISNLFLTFLLFKNVFKVKILRKIIFIINFKKYLLSHPTTLVLGEFNLSSHLKDKIYSYRIIIQIRHFNKKFNFI